MVVTVYQKILSNSLQIMRVLSLIHISFLQLGLGQGGTRGVVGVAEVDDVDALVRNLRDERCV